MTLLIMAAGSGSRYGGLKQFDGLGPNGEYLLEYTIFNAIAAGFNHIVVIAKPANTEDIKVYLSQKLPENIALTVLGQAISDVPEGFSAPPQREKPWGTAHAVWTAREVIKTPFATVNADDYYGPEAFKDAGAFLNALPNHQTYGLVAYELKNTLSDYGTVSRGVCEVKDGALHDITERTKLIASGDHEATDEDSGLKFPLTTPVSMNFWLSTPFIFPAITQRFESFLSGDTPEKGELYLPFIVAEQLEAQEVSVGVIPTSSQWFGLTYSQDKAAAIETLKNLHESGVYPAKLWKA
jgi:NDP-sugar pyrophosphorylase family protein